MPHKFIFSGEVNERRVYLVKCKNTSGEFSTTLWDSEKITRGTCPCCGEIVERSILK